MSVGESPWKGRRLHFIGVGGAGMSGYARVARALGAVVSGSDVASGPYVDRLIADGVLQARVGHAAANVPAGEGVEVVYSSAVAAENVERRAARERGLIERPRAELLAELTGLKRTIAVAGTHGKTTTASMLVHAMRRAGLEPGWLVGGPIGGDLPNADWGAGEWLVVEADESDRSMLSLNVEIAVLTNVELDHHATFASLAELRDAFRAFLARARSAIVVWDRPDLRALTPPTSGDRPGAERSAEQGEQAADESERAAEPAERAAEGGEPADERGQPTPRQDRAGAVVVVPFDAPAPTLTPAGARFDWGGREVRLRVPGAHNALNAVAALEAARLAGADVALAVGALASFSGAVRRFQLLGSSARGALVYDDYAHHPTEVEAALQAARTLEPRRLVAVFQPHLYSRTESLAREFGRALALADVIALLDVYPARERAEDHPGVSGLVIAEASADAAAGRPVCWFPTFADAVPPLRALLDRGDVCLVMGAGDVDELGRALVDAEVAL